MYWGELQGCELVERITRIQNGGMTEKGLASETIYFLSPSAIQKLEV